MTIVFRVDRVEVRRGGGIQLHIVLRNDSSVTATAMNIKLKQQTKWKASYHKSSRKRTLASVVVPGSELGGGAEKRASGSERGQSATTIAEAAREDVQQQLAAGDGAPYTIYVPRSALLSMEAEKKIEVRHWLSVKLKTSGLNSSPKLFIPVHVRPPETAADSDATMGPLEGDSSENKHAPYG